MSLYAIIKAKIELYNTHDNPAPKTAFEKFKAPFLLFFSHVGKTGRMRAARYASQIAPYKEDPDALLMKVQDDCFLDKLGSSRKLKGRLLEGLCEYLYISEKQINTVSSKLMEDFINAIAPHGPVHLDNNHFHELAMKSLIQSKTKWFDHKDKKNQDVNSIQMLAIK